MLNAMAAEARIVEDLEMGGPTPQITAYVPPTSRRGGRGRGNAANTNNRPRCVSTEETDNGKGVLVELYRRPREGA